MMYIENNSILSNALKIYIYKFQKEVENVKSRKYIKCIALVLIFVMTLSLNIDINIGKDRTNSSSNKHFVQVGIGEVEAEGEWKLYVVLLKYRNDYSYKTYDDDMGYEFKYNSKYNYRIVINPIFKSKFDPWDKGETEIGIANNPLSSGIRPSYHNPMCWRVAYYEPLLLTEYFDLTANENKIKPLINGETYYINTQMSGCTGGNYGYVNFIWIERQLINSNPSITITAPTSNSPLSEADTAFVPSISVSDPDDDTLTCKYYIDAETTPRDTKMATSTKTAKTVNFNSINIGTLTEGNHTMKFEVSDGKAAAVTASVAFKVDKTPPTLGTVTFSSTTTGITISGTATDSIAGMDPYPYKYTVSTKAATSWVTATTYTQTGLSPNTQYTATFEARDIKAHIAKKTQNIYTKAEVPSKVTVNNPTSYTLDVSVTDGNPAATQYQISLNNNTKYVTPEGTLTSSPVWITLSGKKITVKGLSPSTAYTFQVKAKNGDGVETTQSSGVSGTTLIAPPAAPANIIATATDKTITVSWEGAATATGYDMEADGVIIDRGTSTTFTHTNLYPGTPHTYRVRGKNAGGPGNFSAPISKSTLPSKPEVPANIKAIPQSTTVTVTWNNVPGATGYDIEVDGVQVNNGPNTNYIHGSLTPGTNHTYRVRSVNAGDKSDWSSPIVTTTLVDSTPVPVNLKAEPSYNQIKVTWSAVDGATGYEVEVDGIRIDNGANTTYIHKNLIPDTQHMYRVRAKKNSVISDWSAAVISTTLIEAFGTPMNFRADADDTFVILTWDPVADATSYELEIDGVVMDNGMETVCIHEGLLPSSEHSYRIRAKNEEKTSEWSQILNITTYVLPSPKDFTATVTENSIKTVWEEVYEAASYDLEFDGSIISDIRTAEYESTGLLPNTQHTMRVRAIGQNGSSNWSEKLTKSTLFNGFNTPHISGLARRTSVYLMWNPMDEAIAYDIEIDGQIIEDIADTSYLHNSLVQGTEHSYKVRAKYESKIGDWSSSFKVSTLSQNPEMPTNVAVSSTTSSILVSWDKVNGAEAYEVEVDGVIVDGGNSTSYLHSGLIPETEHNYRVRARNVGGYSMWSEIKNIKTKSTVQIYVIDSLQEEDVNLILSAAHIQDLNNYTFTVTYNVDDFEVIDLCAMTPRTDLNTGVITGTDITITQFTPGTIVFKKAGAAQTWEVWSGAVNSIRFKAKREGQSTITYSIN